MTQEFIRDFSEVVNNVNGIARETRHSNASDVIKKEVKNFNEFIKNVANKASTEVDGAGYILDKMLDAMDYLLDKHLVKMNKNSYDYRVINSLYDIVRCFYFDI